MESDSHESMPRRQTWTFCLESHGTTAGVFTYRSEPYLTQIFCCSNFSDDHVMLQPPEAQANASQEFVPMVWGASSISELSSWCPLDGSTALLGFNEPNLRQQSNLSAAEACELWPTVRAAARKYGLKLGSPAANYCVPGEPNL